MHKQCFEKASCNPTLWKHLLCENFSFLQLDLVLAAKSMEDIKAGKTLNVSQLCINVQDGTNLLLLTSGQFVPTFKNCEGRWQRSLSNCSNDILVSQPSKEAAAQLKDYSPMWWTVPLGSAHTWTECPRKLAVICLSAADQWSFP